MPTAYGKQMQVLNQGMASSELELVLLPDENPLLIFYHLHKVPKAHCSEFQIPLLNEHDPSKPDFSSLYTDQKTS